MTVFVTKISKEKNQLCSVRYYWSNHKEDSFNCKKVFTDVLSLKSEIRKCYFPGHAIEIVSYDISYFW